MKLQETIEPIAVKLGEVLSASDVPRQYREMGTRLLDHLRRPVRIVVTGMAESGKSSLINMILSRQVLGGCGEVPLVDVVSGAEDRVHFETEDGNVSVQAGLLVDAQIPDRIVHVKQELSDQALSGQTYCELGLSNDAAANRRLLSVVLQDADIVLWCTSGFGQMERDLWSAVADEIKDHSFLVITKADHQVMWGILSKTIEELEPIVNEEFLGLFPVASLQAMAALTTGPQIVQDLWNSSGGQSLREELDRQIQSGRAADMDMARMIVNQCKVEIPGAQIQTPSPAVNPEITQARQTQAIKSAETGQGGDMDAGKPVARVMADADQILGNIGTEMLGDLDGDHAVDTDAIMTRCIDAVQALSSHLQETDCDDSVVLNAREDAQKSEEMMVLFQLERGEEATLDAIMLLLQLRKEFAAKASA